MLLRHCGQAPVTPEQAGVLGESASFVMGARAQGVRTQPAKSQKSREEGCVTFPAHVAMRRQSAWRKDFAGWQPSRGRAITAGTRAEHRAWRRFRHKITPTDFYRSVCIPDRPCRTAVRDMGRRFYSKKICSWRAWMKHKLLNLLYDFKPVGEVSNGGTTP